MSSTERKVLIATLELYGFEPASKMVKDHALKTIMVGYRRSDRRTLRAEPDSARWANLALPREGGLVGILSASQTSPELKMVDEGGAREPRLWRDIPTLHLRLMMTRLQRFNAKQNAASEEGRDAEQ